MNAGTAVIVVLGIAVLVSAIAADRSARKQHRLRAVCLNLFGLGCLAAGLLSLYCWSHGRQTVMRQLAMASVQLERGGLASLLIAESDTQAAEVPPPAPTPPAPPAAAADDTQPAQEVDPAVMAEDPDPQPPADADDEPALPDDMQRQVQIDYAARPDWVDSGARDEGPVHRVSICAGPFPQLRQAQKELLVELKRATDEYINELLGSRTAARWIGYDVARIRQNLVAPKNYYDEKVISPSVGPMHQSHALLEFGPEFHRDVERTWQQIVMRARLVKVALVSAAVLGTLALLFSFFQADSATRGFYTGRLKFATFVAILGLIASGIFLARSIPWLWP